jgi:hypothetical protein
MPSFKQTLAALAADVINQSNPLINKYRLSIRMSLASYGDTDDDETLLRISSTSARSTTRQLFAIMLRKDVTN